MQHGGGQVVRLHQLPHPRAGPLALRQAQDHRHAGAGVVEVGALGDELVVPDHVAVVGHEQHQGVVRETAPLQFGQDAPHLPVEEGDRCEVAVPHVGKVAAARVPAVASDLLPLPLHRARDRIVRRGQRAHRIDGGAVHQAARLARMIEVRGVRIEEAHVEKEGLRRIALGEEGDGALGGPGAEVRLRRMVVLRP